MFRDTDSYLAIRAFPIHYRVDIARIADQRAIFYH